MTPVARHQPAAPEPQEKPVGPVMAAGPGSAGAAGAPPAGVPTWRELVAQAADRLRPVEGGNPGQEARWLAEHAGGLSAGELQLALDRPVSPGAEAALDDMLSRRVAGEPLQYVLGRWSFRTLDLVVDRRVLIPRPETEQLVEAALEECDRLGATTAVDLGTGSGAIALSLLVERPDLEVWATDVSPDALAIARINLDELGTASSRGHLAEGAWFDALPGHLRSSIDVVISNPPYVAEPEMAELPDEVRAWEPREALAAGPEGLDALATIVAAAPGWLARPGALLCEMASHQSRQVADMATEAGFTSVSVWPDLTGRDRILHARL